MYLNRIISRKSIAQIWRKLFPNSSNSKSLSSMRKTRYYKHFSSLHFFLLYVWKKSILFAIKWKIEEKSADEFSIFSYTKKKCFSPLSKNKFRWIFSTLDLFSVENFSHFRCFSLSWKISLSRIFQSCLRVMKNSAAHAKNKANEKVEGVEIFSKNQNLFQKQRSQLSIVTWGFATNNNSRENSRSSRDCRGPFSYIKG